MRPYTKTIFKRKGPKNTGIMASVIRRKSSGRKFDVIQLYINSLSQKEPLLWEMTPTEALDIGAALTFAAHEFFEEFKPYQTWQKKLKKS